MKLFGALLMALAQMGMSEAECPSGMVSVSGSTTCFKLIKERMSWNDSWARCASEVLVLARPEDSIATVALRRKLLDTYGSLKHSAWVSARGTGTGWSWQDSAAAAAVAGPGSGSVDEALVVLHHRIFDSTSYCLALFVKEAALAAYPAAPYETDACSYKDSVLCQDMSTSDLAAGVWSPWSSWSPCSVSCGKNGSRTRTRFCNRGKAKACQGSGEETTSCDSAPCPIIDEKCGRTSKRLTRIVGGQETIAGQYPWMVHISYAIQGSTFTFDCGGTLISKRLVLTAAHCTRDLGRNTVVIIKIGFVNHKKQEPLTEVFLVYLNDFIIHDRYKLYGNTVENDIALIKLPHDTEFNSRIQPICIGQNSQIPFGGKAVAAGWGLLKHTDKEIPDILHDVELDVLGEYSCNRTQNYVCAWTENKDTCSADSGGPLMIQQDDQWYIIGIVSHGPKECGISPKAGRYTRVGNYLEFINDKL